MPSRLIVRRVRDLAANAGQGELFVAYRYHAVFTDSPFELVQAEAQHRGHAIVEQVFADLNDGPLAHLPSGVFAANAAWLTLAVIAHNLLRAAGCLAGVFHARARGATLRGDLIDIAARVAAGGRGHITVHLPEGWYHQHKWTALHRASSGPPATAARGLKPAQATRTHPAATAAIRPSTNSIPTPGPPNKPQESKRPNIHANIHAKDHDRRKRSTESSAVYRG